jgi:hypothetical protein
MKRVSRYVGLFLVVCIAVYGFSGLLDKAIHVWYLSEVKSELNRVFKTNETLYIDGGMLSIHLVDSQSDFEVDGVLYDSFGGDEQYGDMRGKIYRVERVNQPDVNYRITLDDSKPIYQLTTVLTLIRVMFWRKVITNMTTLIVAGLLLYLFERKGLRQKKEEKITQSACLT